MESLREQSSVNKHYRFVFKAFDGVSPGDPTGPQIAANLSSAKLILLLESPAFHNDKTIKEHVFSSPELEQTSYDGGPYLHRKHVPFAKKQRSGYPF